jgi:hypothetical protein
MPNMFAEGLLQFRSNVAKVVYSLGPLFMLFGTTSGPERDRTPLGRFTEVYERH